MNKHSCIRCYVSGKVQGVWFRASAKEHAEQIGVHGWAKNLPDGRVEVFACGSHEQLKSFYLWLKQGPPLARVDDCIREELDWEDGEGFNVL